MNVACDRLAASQRVSSRNITESDELLQVIMKTPFRNPGVGGDFWIGRKFLEGGQQLRTGLGRPLKFVKNKLVKFELAEL